MLVETRPTRDLSNRRTGPKPRDFGLLARSVGPARGESYNEEITALPDSAMPKSSTQRIILLSAVVVVAGCLAAGFFIATYGGDTPGTARPSDFTLEQIPFDGNRAYSYLEQLCALGRRYSGSEGMRKQQALIISHFEKLGAKVERQSWRIRHPLDGSAVELTNIIVRWHPQIKDRVLLAAHYDTRPYPDRDPETPRGLFVGANDGASGVAVLMELGNTMSTLKSRYGVDFVFFDAEEFVFDQQRDRYFLGSEYFSRDYRAGNRGYEYRWAVLLDMIGDADLQIYYERNSLSWRDSRPLVEEIWATANRLGITEFVPRGEHRIRDDHLPLHNTARIPSCDIIDFDYPYWHTTEDTPDKCSPLSLAKVGWVIREWLATTQ